jgi:hypothetical protein
LPFALLLAFLTVCICSCCCGCGSRRQMKAATWILAKVAAFLASKHIWMPKVKIIISMVQVQESLVPTFGITLPKAFAAALQSVNIWSVNVPWDCVMDSFDLRVDFHWRLLYSTLSPTVIVLTLFLCSPCASARKEDTLMLAQRREVDKKRIGRLRKARAAMTVAKKTVALAKEAQAVYEEVKAAPSEKTDVDMGELADAALKAAIKSAVAKLKPRIEPELEQYGLGWEIVEPAIEMVDTVEEIQAAVANPEEFLQKY